MTETAPATGRDMTVAQLQALIGQSYELDREIDEIEKKTVEPLKAKLREIDATILATLEALEMTSFKTPHGTVVRTNRFSVQVPKDIEAKSAFFKWLSEKGREVYWQYVTVNSQSLNSLYKQEMEIAKEAGNLDFSLPGIGQPTFSATLSRRKK